MTTHFPVAALERLAKRVTAGQAVFFVGAGFSLDSEKNKPERLIARLLARFASFSIYLASGRLELEEPKPALGKVRRIAGNLRKELTTTFRLPPHREICTLKNVALLARQYYNLNDWMCSAFSELLELAKNLKDPIAAEEQISTQENQLLARFGDGEPLEKLQLKRFRDLSSPQNGKALFLETMGFSNPKIMGGVPHTKDIRETLESYDQRLRHRHFVLAWLAREGLCPILLTTNYDLLLEGAYALSGFDRRGDSSCFHKQTLPVSLPFFAPIAGPWKFSSFGDSYRTALILKIHGCVEEYRLAQNDNCTWGQFLRSMVFTYREVQNWRQDFWSRDFLRTILRTRSLIFCGYSGVDPVLHDTFRAVYEELAERSERRPATIEAKGDLAFFFGEAGSTDFHALEILRAARIAAGEPDSRLMDDSNYLPFNFLSNSEVDFPHLDDLMAWIFHLVFRERQAQAFETDLHRLSYQLWKQPCAAGDLEILSDRLSQIRREERRAALSWTSDTACRRQFSRIVAWTNHFHRNFLRELAIAQNIARQGGAIAVAGDSLRAWQWYVPTVDYPEWAAWGAVVEIALRRMIASWRGLPKAWALDDQWFTVQDAGHPQVHFARSANEPSPVRLSIRVTGFGRSSHAGETLGAFRRKVFWELDPVTLPWRSERRGQTPSAEFIWHWATTKKVASAPEAARYLGLADD